MLDSFLLSVFMFVFCILALWVFAKADFEFLKQGPQLRLSYLSVIAIVVTVVGLSAAGSWYALTQANQSVLQGFYIIFFSLGFLLSWIIIFPKSKIWLPIGCLVTGSFLFAIFASHSQLLQNIFMACSALWIGPVVFKRLHLKFRYFIAGIILFLVIDIYNVYFTHSSVAFSDDTLLLNGLIVFGSWLLGIGDFFLAYLTVNAVQKDMSKTTAVVLSAVIAFARFFIRLFFPHYNHDIPYFLIITPATLVAYAYKLYKDRIKKLNIFYG